MKHRLLALSVLTLLGLSFPARADIDAQVNAVLQDRLLANATVIVEVMSLGSGPADLRELYARNAHLPLVPASNLKLVTTAAALEHLGPDFKFSTRLLLVGQDLVLIGDGDPTFGDPAFTKEKGFKPTSDFEAWAARLQQAGITTIRDVLVDDSVMDEQFAHPDWPSDQLDEYYEAQVGGLNFAGNTLDLTIGADGNSVGVWPMTRYATFKSSISPGSKRVFTVSRDLGTNIINLHGDPPARGGKVVRTIHDPPMFGGTVLAETLTNAGIKVAGSVKRDRTFRARLNAPLDPALAAMKPVVVGEYETPIGPVLSRTNKASANLYAESLCKRMGYDAATKATGSWQTGLEAVRGYLKKTGIPEEDFRLADGCGLSKKNAISARALVRVLCYEYYGKNRDLYIRSLSIAGVDGTLDDRFARSDLQRRVFGKSGFVEGVSTLSGYLQAKDGQWHAFSIMINGIPRQSNSQIKLLQEKIVKAVDAEVSPKK
ncbi:D-alanyl-D-alanine carboxypeptidase/D-alanyl-D-alanine endopeptidase [Humisphaera borealis]|uniref:D-alanyl-D-alanine carboxypeptidase/D-alanyl-D-alanine-endopeptidase n=1 Tax=Humisphaera borealis TaxID=2807512 RepID=A0A7M2WTV5_9BACT|nr:D-alanyl-D-alanine carboxypeptidase/D-alanyl-D-alanine-endopeptidase [Humisphaera borealis]QOV88948.1 D-alanyl-D-alanine carboxypeptidase/D-alanyl-D-alanine-endopeptidase [Humisphaera borealis]